MKKSILARKHENSNRIDLEKISLSSIKVNLDLIKDFNITIKLNSDKILLLAYSIID